MSQAGSHYVLGAKSILHAARQRAEGGLKESRRLTLEFTCLERMPTLLGPPQHGENQPDGALFYQEALHHFVISPLPQEAGFLQVGGRDAFMKDYQTVHLGKAHFPVFLERALGGRTAVLPGFQKHGGDHPVLPLIPCTLSCFDRDLDLGLPPVWNLVEDIEDVAGYTTLAQAVLRASFLLLGHPSPDSRHSVHHATRTLQACE